MRYDIDPDIARARTLDPSFYASDAAFAATRERIFARTWQWLGDVDDVALPGSLSPRMLLPGCLDEPLLLARDGAGTLRCLSNVCTHRANLLVRAPCRASDIRCGYHSRRFDLAGRMTFMPGFADAAAFPSPADDLPHVPVVEIGGHAFVALDPAAPATSFLGDMIERTAHLAPEDFVHDPSRDRDFSVNAHWALYVENYLEGLHIPYVHPELASTIDSAGYTTELFAFASVQQARARPGERRLRRQLGGGVVLVRISQPHAQLLPVGVVDQPRGADLAGTHACPLSKLCGRRRPARRGRRRRARSRRGAGRSGGRGGAAQACVHACSRAAGTRPTFERGVHHFHRLLARFLAQ